MSGRASPRDGVHSARPAMAGEGGTALGTQRVRAAAVGALVVVLCARAHRGRGQDEAKPKNPWLCQGAFYTEAQAREKLAEYAKTYSDRAGWEKRAQTIREGILRGAGLDPLPERTPLRPVL